MGTMGPQGADATVIVGVNTAGMVRVNMLSTLEALLIIVANGAEIITVFWGSGLLLTFLFFTTRECYGAKRVFVSIGVAASFLFTGLGVLTNLLNCAAFAADAPWKRKDRLQRDFWIGLFIIKAGLAIPFAINSPVAAARDANLIKENQSENIHGASSKKSDNCQRNGSLHHHQSLRPPG